MLEPGTQIGRYEIHRRLGRGGMGAVYVAHDPVLGRMVAIKVFAGELDVQDARERFSREARSAAALNHPEIVTVYDFGEYSAQPYIVMEYVQGETLSQLIRRKAPISMATKLQWMEQLCAGAGYAHKMSVIHRDIKPANLMVNKSGKLKILDFGIARMMDLASNTTALIGTPGYMAPEQIQGEPVDHRSDLFSIGVVFYELLTYKEAFSGDTVPTITHRILSEEPVPVIQLAPDVSPEVVSIVERALKKNPAERFDDAEAMGKAVSRVRRQFEPESGMNMPPLALPKDAAPTDRVHRGTESPRSPAEEAAAPVQATPSPDVRRTDREGLARRRAAQLEAALQEAHRLFAQRDLAAALDACEQALTFDETHAGALALEQTIQAAIEFGETVAQPGSGRAQGRAELGSMLDSELARLEVEAETRVDTKAPAPSGVGAASVAAVPVESAGDRTVLRGMKADATILAPPRRTPIPTRPPATPAQTAKPAKAPVVRDSFAWLRTLAPALRALVPTSAPKVRGAKIGRAKIGGLAPAVWVGAGTLVAAAILAAIFMFPFGPAPTGTVVIDAVPWALVTAIEADGGERQTLPAPASTPVALTLPAGDYQIVLTGPPPDSQQQRLKVHVEQGRANVVPLTRFRVLTPEEYFDQYLSAPAPTSATPGDVAPAPTAGGQ